MYKLNAAIFLVSFVLTWEIGLLPPVLIRFVFLKRPIANDQLSAILCFPVRQPHPFLNTCESESNP